MEAFIATPEPLTVQDIQAVLKDSWPSIDPAMTTFASGTTVTSTIWHFVVEITLTTTPIVYGEKAGVARMTFSFKPPGVRSTVIKTVTNDQHPAVMAFVRQCKMYLNGIVAAIEQAGEQPSGEAPSGFL